MENTAWIELIRLVPEKQHNNLLVMTTTGVEIAIQDIMRTEANYLVLRGRLSGTTDTGRVFFVPYEGITYLGFYKPVKEEDVYAMYGAMPPEAKTAPADPPLIEAPPEAKEEVSAEVKAEENEPPPPAGESPPPGRNPTPARGSSRTDLLQRLRSRAQNANGK